MTLRADVLEGTQGNQSALAAARVLVFGCYVVLGVLACVLALLVGGCLLVFSDPFKLLVILRNIGRTALQELVTMLKLN